MAVPGTTLRRLRKRSGDRSLPNCAQEAEELMKDNLAASLVLALGLGLVVGYLIRRSTE